MLTAQVAGRTNDSAGDGTTTAAVLARELIHFGLQSVTAGANPISVKRGIDRTCDFLVAKLKEVAKPVKGRLDIKVRGRHGEGGGAGAAWAGAKRVCVRGGRRGGRGEGGRGA